MSTNSEPNKTEVKPFGNHVFNISLGVLGMVIAAYGNLLNHANIMQKWCYLIGGLLLLISSSLERQRFFIILQVIISSGAAIAFFALTPWVKASVPISLTVIAIIYFIIHGEFKDKLTILGCIGLAILAVGYAVTNPIIYMLGSAGLMVYSFISYRRGIAIALVWAILNAVFMVTASIAVYRMLVAV